MTVRAFFRAAKVENMPPPYDTIHLKLFYPADLSQSDREWGEVPADRSLSPFPVVILFNGINCGSETYQWLAVKLADRGFVVVTFVWISENLPGIISLTPGVNVEMWKPEKYGSGPTSSALPTILAELERVQAKGILAGLLDLNQIVLGGHSAGGRVAIENADRRFFPQIAAAFSYGAHTAAPMMLGYEHPAILPLSNSVPMFLMGGTRDGVIANSSHRYGMASGDATHAIIRTFHEAIAGGKDECYLLILEGANHFTFCHPIDPTTGTSFLDFTATQNEEELRDLMGEAIALFLEGFVRQKPESATALDRLLNRIDPLIQLRERK